MKNMIHIKDIRTSDDVYIAFLRIKNESSRNAKLAILAEEKEKGNTLFTLALRCLFDNTINFGVIIPDDVKSKVLIEILNNNNPSQFEATAIEFLDALSKGAYTRTQAIDRFVEIATKLSRPSFELLAGIVNKDIRIGVNTTGINKVFKGLIPTFPYMRCSLPTQVSLEELEWKAGVYAQEKADGMFVNINVNNESVALLSRQGTIVPLADQFPQIAKDLADVLPLGKQVHGEMLVVDPNGKVVAREIGNGIINSLCKSGDFPEGWTLLFRVWDAVPLTHIEAKGKYTEPYSDRFEHLHAQIMKAIFRHHQEGRKITCVETIQTQRCYSIEQAQAFYKNMLMSGKEGAVLKNPTAIWRDGTSKEQVKLKLICDCDLQVVDFEEGKGKFKGNLGAVICRSSDNLLEVSVSGFNDKVRREIWDNRNKFVNTIMTVRFNDVMVKEGELASLFLPRFVEFRTDKTDADSLERIIATKEKAIKLQ